MKLPKIIKSTPDEDDDKGWLALTLLLLFRHGEKFIAVAVVVAAMGLAVRSWDYQPLSWEPNELEELANHIEDTIKNNGYTITSEKISVFNYAVYAEQIKETIPTEPYRSLSEWKPVLQPDPQLRGSVDILTVAAVRGEAVRRHDPTAQRGTVDRWQRPPLEGTQQRPLPPNESAIWVNLYGTIPLGEQWEIFNQTFDNAIEANRPQYVYYEWERAEISPRGEHDWQPVIVYSIDESQTVDALSDRLIPFEQRRATTQEHNDSMLLFSDFDVEPAKTYAYRVRLYLVNPNFDQQETTVEEGVDTQSKYVRSDWSFCTNVYVPDRTSVRLASVTPTDTMDFPRQTVPLGTARGVIILDYFDTELGHTLPSVEKSRVERGMLVNMSKDDANRFINLGKPRDERVNINYPEVGLRPDVCVMDFGGGRKLQKRPSRETPDLFVTGKALLLMPDGTMQVTTSAPELW
jgi:hypothetical protein